MRHPPGVEVEWRQVGVPRVRSLAPLHPVMVCTLQAENGGIRRRKREPRFEQPAQRELVTPETMRAVAAGLTRLADEWSTK